MSHLQYTANLIMCKGVYANYHKFVITSTKQGRD